MTDPFEITGSTEGKSSDDILREICGDDTDATDANLAITGESGLASRVPDYVGDSNGDERTDGDSKEPGSRRSTARPRRPRAPRKPAVDAGVSGDSGEHGSGPAVPAEGQDREAVRDDQTRSDLQSLRLTTAGGVTPGEASATLDEYLTQHKGEFFVYDLETVPDTSRFPKPEPVEKQREEIDLAALQKSTADGIKTRLQSGVLMEDQLQDLMQLELESKKPRSSVLKDIRAAVERLGSTPEIDEWARYALDPWRCRIVAMSWCFVSEGVVHTIVSRTIEDEYRLLDMFWLLHDTGTRVGFNISGFDDQVIFARSMLLRFPVSTQKRLDISRYSKSRIDLMNLVFGYAGNAIDCKSFAQMLGIMIPSGDIRGSDVLRLVESEDWDSLASYSNSDVAVEREMFKMVRSYIHI